MERAFTGHARRRDVNDRACSKAVVVALQRALLLSVFLHSRGKARRSKDPAHARAFRKSTMADGATAAREPLHRTRACVRYSAEQKIAAKMAVWLRLEEGMNKTSSLEFAG